MKKNWLKKKFEGKIVFLKFTKKYSESIPHVPPDDFFEISPILKFQLLDRYWTYPFKDKLSGSPELNIFSYLETLQSCITV